MGILEVLLVSAMPISEIRGGLPLALYYGFDPVEAYILSLIGNILPVPFLILFLEELVKITTRFRPIDRFYRLIVRRVEKRREFVEKYGYIGLTFFVAIPLPVTGAWTGSLIAFLLGLDKKKSVIFISMGVSIAGVIVLLTSLGVINLMNIL
jgi:uncharacterized membrane protein